MVILSLILIIFVAFVWCIHAIFTGIHMICKDVKNVTHQDIVTLCTIATILVTSTYLTAIIIAPEVQGFFTCA